MASSERRPNYARRFMALAIFIVLAIAAYSAGWYYLARQIDAGAQTALVELERAGLAAVCADRSVRGYPFRIGLYCDSVAADHAAEGVTFSAGQFRSAGQIYDPRFIIGELDAPARFEMRGLPPLALDWDILRASVRLASPLPKRVSLESRAIVIATAETPVAAMEEVEAHMRPDGQDLDLALRFDGLSLDPALVQGRQVPALSGDADIALADGVAFAASGARNLRGRSGTIRNVRLAAGEASIALAGPFAVDDEGLVNAELTVAVENPRELSALLGQALPEFADQIETAFSGLAVLGGVGGDTPTLPLTISQGRISIAFLDLGEIPPL